MRLSYNSACSGFRPNLDARNAVLFGNGDLIQQGAFDAGLFQQALSTLQLSSRQISQVIVPQWIGQSKAVFTPPRPGRGLISYYGSYRDYWNPSLNGVLRTFNLFVGRSL